MNPLVFEVRKILGRRFALILLMLTTVLLPVIIKIGAYLNVVKDKVPEGLFANSVAYGIIVFTQTYFFLPAWIIILCGTELSNGHVNRVVFHTSRKFYFISKLIFCGLLTIYFSVLGIVAMVVSIKTSPFPGLAVDLHFYFEFFFQLMISSFLFATLLLCLVFFIRSALRTFVVYFIWAFLEGILFIFVEARYNVELKLLPLHLVRTTFSRNGEADFVSYYNPISENIVALAVPTIFICALTFFSYRRFLKSNLPALSD